jgi:alpha-tubulin suppressor-like RCC1 family protein
MSIKGIDITQLGYRWKGIYSPYSTYINNDVVYNNGGVYVYRNGSLQAFALGQQDAAVAGALAANGVVSVGGWGTVLHSNGPGSSLVFKFQNDRNGILATKLCRSDMSGGQYIGPANHMLAIMNEGQVRAWGNTNGGSTGTGTMSSNGQTLPKQVAFPKGTPPIIDITSNVDQTFFLDANGGLWSCGPNNDNSSGYGFASGVPVKINGYGQMPASAVIKSIWTGFDWYGGRAQAAIDQYGVVYRWGIQNQGDFGVGNTNTYTTPVIVPLSQTVPMKAVYLSGGNYQTAHYIDTTGTLWVTGASDWNGIAGGSVLYPMKFMPWGDSNTVKLVRKTETDQHWVAGAQYTGRVVVVLDSGDLYMWGDDGGQVSGGWGTGYTGTIWSGNSLFPYKVLTNVADAWSISGGYSRSWALKKDGTVWANGYDGYNAVNGGNGNTTTWAQLYSSVLTNVVKMRHVGGTYGSFLAALRSDGKLVCWGIAGPGASGTGVISGDNSISPVTFALLDRTIVDFTICSNAYGGSSDVTVYALTSDGRIYGWGSAGAGRLNDSRDNNRYTPHPIIF